MLVKHQRAFAFEEEDGGGGGGPAFDGIGERGLVAGGRGPGSGMNNTIDYITIATLGNASDFGDLTANRMLHASCAGNGRGVFIGGLDVGGVGNVNNIDYVTIATTGNASDFGDTISPWGSWGITACSDGTRGVHGEGPGGSSTTQSGQGLLHYITIATLSDSTSFGVELPGNATGSNSGWVGNNCPNYVQQPHNKSEKQSSFADATRGVFGKGTATYYYYGGMAIDYVTIATTGTATFFGLNVQRCANGSQYGVPNQTPYNTGPYGSGYRGTGTSDGTRGIFAGGYGYYSMGWYRHFCSLTGGQNFIDYLTIATTGNAADFGDLTIGRQALAGFNNNTRSCFSGGTTNSYWGGNTDTIDYITTQTTGNATDFGDLSGGKFGVSGCSGD